MAEARRPRIAVFLSGSGRTLQNLLDRAARGALAGTIELVVSDQATAHGLVRARAAGVPAFHERDPERQHALLREHAIDLVCLAGYLRLFPVPKGREHAVLNIHPALLPKYGGKGFYGDRVHAAVLAAGDTESGCTVHFCDAVYDHGRILLQRKVPVLPGDDVQSLAARVFAAECEAYPDAIALWARTASTRTAPDTH